MDIVETVGSTPLIDLLIFLALFASFIVGVMQGSIRRFLGIIAILFAFLVAANLRDAFGDFLADNWTQFPHGYDRLLAFLIIWVAGSIALSIVIQGFYKRTDIYAARPIVDDVVGGMLGLLEGFLVLVIAVVILNSFTLPDPRPGDLTPLREAIDLVHRSAICNGIQDVAAPVFVHLLAIILPSDLVAVFP
jgi:uncharacterized membrane protein required for colicin V production